MERCWLSVRVSREEGELPHASTHMETTECQSSDMVTGIAALVDATAGLAECEPEAVMQAVTRALVTLLATKRNAKPNPAAARH